MVNESSEMDWDEFAKSFLNSDPMAEDDESLFAWATSIIANPKAELESFTMHAPLEIMARFLLLPRIDPDSRPLARLQLAASTRRYTQIGESLALPPAAEGDDIDTLLEVTRSAVARGKVEPALAAMERLIALDAHGRIVDGLCDLLVAHYSCGAHSHIFLNLFSQLSPAQQRAALPMIRGFIHQVSQHPDQVIAPAGSGRHNPTYAIADALEQAQVEVVKLDETTKGGISGLLDASLDHKLDAPLRKIIAAGATTTPVLDEGLVIPCRTAALSMIQEVEKHARYGWTHALTLPQAVQILSERFTDRPSAVLASNIYATTYQAIIAKGRPVSGEAPPDHGLTFEDGLFRSADHAASAGWHLAPEKRAAAFDRLATEASIRPDCHCVKYALATRQAAEADPDHAHIYLAAAAKLVHLWIAEYPYDQIIARINERD